MAEPPAVPMTYTARNFQCPRALSTKDPKKNSPIMFASRWNGDGSSWTRATESTRHGCSRVSAGTKLSLRSRSRPGMSSARKATMVTMRSVRVISGGDAERARPVSRAEPS